MPKKVLRESDLEEIYACVQAGESAQVLGMSGVGKSNHFNNVLDPENIDRHFDGHEKRPILVRVNFHYAVDFSPRTVYSLMLEPLEMLGRDPESRQIAAQVTALHSELLDVGDDMLKVQRIFRQAVRLVMQDPDQSLFFVFDQFEKMLINAPARLFANFRGLREEFKYRLGFIIFAQRSLTQLIPEPDPDHDEFLELFQGKKIGLRPYMIHDAQYSLDRITERNAFDIDDAIFPQLYDSSGGHGGLLKAMIFSICQDSWELDANLLNHRYIQNECRKIWESLYHSEQLWLNRKIKDKSISAQDEDFVSAAKETLLLKGVIDKNETLFSPYFERYVNSKKDYQHALEYDIGTKTIYIFGEPMEQKLTPREVEVFEFMYARIGDLITANEIALAIWKSEDSSALQAVRSNVSRLRKKVQAGGNQARFITSASAASGYVLLVD